MSRTIHKFHLAPGTMPQRHERFLHAGIDPAGRPCVWLEVRPDEPESGIVREFQMFGTGHVVPDEGWEHCGSFVDGPFVWHIYGRAAEEVLVAQEGRG
jgi:hypothetical protein